jgi:hypothetical protein
MSVGVMKDNKLKLRNLRASHTLGRNVYNTPQKKKTQKRRSRRKTMGMSLNILLGLLIAAALHEAGASSVLHRWYAHTSCNLFALAHRALPLFSVSRSKAALPGTRLLPRLVPHPTAVDTIGTRPNSRLFSYVLDLDVAALPGGPKTADRIQAE